MDTRPGEQFTYKQQWNRRIINGYWVSVLIYFLAGDVNLIWTYKYYPNTVPYYLAHLMALPLGLLTATVGILEFLHRFYKHAGDYIFLTTGVVIATIISSFNWDRAGVLGVFLLPILISIFYLQRDRVLFAGAMSSLGLIIARMLEADQTGGEAALNFTAALFVVIGGTWIGLGVMTRGIEIMTDLEEKIRSEQDLIIKNIIADKISKTDALTDLYNQKAFREYLETTVRISENTGAPLHLALLDIDNFKGVNDKFGHWTGDLVLRSIADILREALTSNEFLARYGGEEFGIIFTDKTIEESYALLEAVRIEIASTRRAELDGQAITVSMGLSAYSPGQGKEGFFQKTDELLYLAKRTGKNKIVTHDESGRAT